MQRFTTVNWRWFLIGVMLAVVSFSRAAWANLPVFVNTWGSSGGGYGQFDSPYGVAVASDGDVYIADTYNDLIQRFSPDGYFETQWGGSGSGDGQFYYATGVAVANNGTVYVVDNVNHRIQQFDPDGTYQNYWGYFGSGNGAFTFPIHVDVNASGQVYVTDSFNNRVERFSATGTYEDQWGSAGSGNGQFVGPAGIAVAENGQVFVVDSGNSRVQRFSADGDFQLQWGSFGSFPGQFNDAYGIDASQNGLVYVADSTNHRIQRFDADGNYQTSWGSYGFAAGEFRNPKDVAVSGTGAVYVVDTDNHRIQRFFDYAAWVDPATHYLPDSIEIDTGLALDAGKTLYVTNATSVTDGAFLSILGGSLHSSSLELHTTGSLVYAGGQLDVATLNGGQFSIAPGAAETTLTVNAGSTFQPRVLQVYGSSNLFLAGGTVIADELAVIDPGGAVEVGFGAFGGDMGIVNQGEIVLVSSLYGWVTGAGLLNEGVLRGIGEVAAPLYNEPAGEVRVAAGEWLHFSDLGLTSEHSNRGRIEAIGNLQFGGPAEIEFDDPLTNVSGTGLIAARNATLRFDGGLTNQGSFAFSFGTSDVFGDIANTGNISLGGGAEVTFYDDIAQNGSLVIAKAGSTTSKAVVFGSLSGGFTGGGELFALGDLRPGSSPAAVTMGGDLFLGPSTNTFIELGGTTSGDEYDQLLVTGEFALAGTLDVSLIDLGNGVFQPGEGDVFEILTATGGITGGFTAMNLPELTGDLYWNVLQDGDSLTLAVVTPALAGDFNHDGAVDAADYVVWRKTDGTQAGYDTWRSHFGQTAGSGAVVAANSTVRAKAAIPEPATLVLFVLGGAGALLLRCRDWRSLRSRLVPSLAFLATLSIATTTRAEVLSLNPRATYLRTNDDAGALGAPAIDLSAHDITEGDWLLLQRFGAYMPGDTYADNSKDLVGVFSANDSLLADDQLHRVPGAIDAGPEFGTPPTYLGDYQTDIAEDFLISRHNGMPSLVPLQVPVGAQFLFVSPADGFFGDNTDPNGDFALGIWEMAPPGDFNLDGTVDAADYVVWRKCDARVFGFNVWRNHFGQTAGSGAGASDEPINQRVPEPGAWALIVIGSGLLTVRRQWMGCATIAHRSNANTLLFSS